MFGKCSRSPIHLKWTCLNGTNVAVSFRASKFKGLMVMTRKPLHGLFGLLLCASATFAADIPDYPFVFVTGKAASDTPPNIAQCSLTIRAVDQDAAKGQSIVEARLNAVLAMLIDKGIATDDIESSKISKQILTPDFNSKQPLIRGYDMSRSLEFKSRQLTTLPAIEDGLVGAPNVEQISCQFDRTDREALEADLLNKAIHSAREQGDKIAQSLGRHVAAAVAASKAPFDSIASGLGLGDRPADFQAGNRMFKKSVSADELLVPSTVHMSVSVNVLFKMD
jgi:uncharacterized protein YggE